MLVFETCLAEDVVVLAVAVVVGVTEIVGRRCALRSGMRNCLDLRFGGCGRCVGYFSILRTSSDRCSIVLLITRHTHLVKMICSLTSMTCEFPRLAILCVLRPSPTIEAGEARL